MKLGRSLMGGGSPPSHKLMIHKMRPCPSHSYSRAPRHGPRLGQEHQILSGDCPSVLCAAINNWKIMKSEFKLSAAPHTKVINMYSLIYLAQGI